MRTAEMKIDRGGDGMGKKSGKGVWEGGGGGK